MERPWLLPSPLKSEDMCFRSPIHQGGIGTISVNGSKVIEGRINRTQPGIFSVDDLADVGMDEGTMVANYGGSSKFNGKLNKVTIEQKK